MRSLFEILVQSTSHVLTLLVAGRFWRSHNVTIIMLFVDRQAVCVVLRASPPGEAAFVAGVDATADNDDDAAAVGYYYYYNLLLHPFEKSKNLEC